MKKMKKILQTLKLRSFRTEVNKGWIDKVYVEQMIVCFQDGTWDEVYSKEELIDVLRKDHIKPIRYVFNMADKFIIDRDLLINLN